MSRPHYVRSEVELDDSGNTVVKIQPPHKNQVVILDHDGSAVCFAGRRFGKTVVGVYKIWRGAINKPGMYWWVGLTWQSASMWVAWNHFMALAGRIPNRAQNGVRIETDIRRSDKKILLPNGSEIWMRTAEREAALAGAGVRGAVVDEFTLMKEVVWTEYLEATLLDYNGWAFFIGVPKGENWGAKLWRVAATRQGWRQFHYTTYDNPFIDDEAIDLIKQNTPEHVFRQEYMAEVLTDGGDVFKNVERVCINEMQKHSIDGHHYVMGVDLARRFDFTVLTVFDISSEYPEQVFMDRFNEMSWAIQISRIKAAIMRFAPTKLSIDATGLGGSVVERLQHDLQALGINVAVEPVVFNRAVKVELVQSLALAMENEEVVLLNDETLKEEFRTYTAVLTEGGEWKYGAPSGFNDDAVTATTLGYSAARKRRLMAGLAVSPILLPKSSTWRRAI